MYGFVISNFWSCSLFHLKILSVYGESAMPNNHVIQTCYCGVWHRTFPLRNFMDLVRKGVVEWPLATTLQSEMWLILYKRGRHDSRNTTGFLLMQSLLRHHSPLSQPSKCHGSCSQLPSSPVSTWSLLLFVFLFSLFFFPSPLP